MSWHTVFPAQVCCADSCSGCSIARTDSRVLSSLLVSKGGKSQSLEEGYEREVHVFWCCRPTVRLVACCDIFFRARRLHIFCPKTFIDRSFTHQGQSFFRAGLSYIQHIREIRSCKNKKARRRLLFLPRSNFPLLLVPPTEGTVLDSSEAEPSVTLSVYSPFFLRHNKGLMGLKLASCGGCPRARKYSYARRERRCCFRTLSDSCGRTA